MAITPQTLEELQVFLGKQKYGYRRSPTHEQYLNAQKPDERLYTAVPAHYNDGGLSSIGALYLTDRRILFLANNGLQRIQESIAYSDIQSVSMKGLVFADLEVRLAARTVEFGNLDAKTTGPIAYNLVQAGINGRELDRIVIPDRSTPGPGDLSKNKQLIYGLLAVLAGAFLLFVFWPSGDASVAPRAPTLTPMPNPGDVSRAETGEDWPFTVERGTIACLGQGEVIFRTPNGTFAMNEIAEDLTDNPPVTSIIRDGKDASSFLALGESLCR